MFVYLCQASSSSDSLDGPCVDYAKSYDAVVFDVLKVTPEEFAVSSIQMSSVCTVHNRKHIERLITQQLHNFYMLMRVSWSSMFTQNQFKKDTDSLELLVAALQLSTNQ